MPLQEIPAAFWRGGTSKAVVFRIGDLPPDRADWDPVLLGVMGSPDPNGRQLDGMGGGISSLSKVCVLGPATRADADVDFTFAQVPVGAGPVDYGGNCGNMIAAMGPAALDLGLVPAPADGMARVRIHNTNTAKVIVSHFPVRAGQAETDGALAIDGVAGSAAPIRLEFLDPGGAKTGRLLPSGAAVDDLSVAGRVIRASLVDAANPCVFVAATDLGLTGAEHPDLLAGDKAFLSTMESIRRAGSVRMGLAPDPEGAAGIQSIPKIAIVAPPRDATLLSGAMLPADRVSIMVRMLSMEQPHRAVPITGAICLAISARIPGTVAHAACAAGEGPLTISHPSGSTLVDAELSGAQAVSGSVYRTARKLFGGAVFFRG
ncbi:putative methylaconitate Delta-isomerase PrpF [Primorskyibacter flagellatus]|uniref:Methylaconitate Delta-isomerase PrpF n=1 Tax=Primorskyibacter flagellatus TaxID=1387277 RepID=A0A917AGI3_9RHOB|nr:PrpF domain-containing protein [Primorskyibacter flagellatus]GGE51148.1 putative methylaconitate Delta-isomerase PrpF [Primorskyibacter flagellatus]